MTNNSPLDEHIKGKFGNYTPEVPAHIWENIIAEKDKRRPLWFWFSVNKNLFFLLFGIMITGAGIIIYKNFYSLENSKVNAINEPVKINTEKINNIPAETNGKPTNNVSAEINNKKSREAENILASVNHINKTTTIISGDKNTITTGKDKPAGINKNNLLLSSVGDRKNDLPISLGVNDMAKSNSGEKSKYLKGTAVISYKNPQATSDDINNITETNPSDPLLNRILLNLDLIRAEKTFNISVKKINNPHLGIPCPAAEKNAAGNKKYFEIYGGPDYAFRSITDTGNSTYLQKRKESTSFSSAFSVGLRYTRVFGNGMSFRTGINYSHINEKFKFAQGNIIQVVYIINSNGDTTGSYTTTGTRYKTTYNKFRTVDVPILVGYELGNGKIHANFNAGAIINLYSWQEGDVLDTAFQPVSITTGKTSSPYQFKTNVGIGFIGAVSVYYKLTDKWHIFAEPYYRYNFSPASKASLTLKQKYSTAGLRLGIRFDF